MFLLSLHYSKILLNRDRKQLLITSFLTSISNRSAIFKVFFLKPFPYTVGAALQIKKLKFHLIVFILARACVCVCVCVCVKTLGLWSSSWWLEHRANRFKTKFVTAVSTCSFRNIWKAPKSRVWESAVKQKGREWWRRPGLFSILQEELGMSVRPEEVLSEKWKILKNQRKAKKGFLPNYKIWVLTGS